MKKRITSRCPACRRQSRRSRSSGLHWSIENQLHRILDVLFDEDDALSRENYAPENLVVILHLAQNILRAHPIDRSMSLKMFRDSISKEFFFELFAHMR